MSTLVRIIVSLIISLFFTSCINFGEGIKGNGNVESEERPVPGEFTEIKVSEGLDVFVTQDDKASITVEADENIIGLIRTDIQGDVLNIHLEERVGRAESKKVLVTLPHITRFETSSGAQLETNHTIDADRLEIHSSSGSHLKVSVNADEVNCHSSSGSHIRISGTTGIIYADASSGSHIKANELRAKKAVSKASSGANITINASEESEANSSSGGNVHNYGSASTTK